MLKDARTFVPLWLKIGYTLWLLAWLTLSSRTHQAVELLWLCHMGNLILAVALWRESALLFSWQAVGLLLVQIIFTVDVLARVLFGRHVIGGTEYLFDPSYALVHRVLALFHVIIPVLLIWGLLRLGYDRRAILWQTAEVWLLLPAGYFLGGPEKNLNWVYGPFDQTQTLFPPLTYLVICMIVYPVLIHLPTHLVLARLLRVPIRESLRGAEKPRQ